MRAYSHSRYPLPGAWETLATASRSQMALSYLKVEGLRVKYVGPGENDGQAATVIANHPVPSDCPLFYFEVEILNRGREGYIGVGFQTDEVTLARLPGWEVHSYGYHGDDGYVFSGSGRGQSYGPGYATGDVIGALLNRAERTISFFKNGTPLGVAFTNVPEERLHPCVGLRSQGEDVQANLGALPFRVDFEAMVTTFREQVSASVAEVPLPLVTQRGLPLLPQLLHDHLVHHRCSATAAIIARDLLRGQGDSSTGTSSAGTSGAASSDADRPGGDVACRQRVYELVVAGKIEAAVQEVEQQYTRAPLEGNPALDFQLKVAHFCELLRGNDASAMEAALTYGRQVLAPHRPKGPAEEELLSDALSLLAYERPEASPCGHLMGQEWRRAVADSLNGAILKHQGLPSVSPLERIFQQTTLVLSELQQSNHPQALMLDLHKVLVGPATGGGGTARVQGSKGLS